MLRPTEIIDAQIKSYLSRDAEAFSLHYTPDAICEQLRTGDVIAQGREEICTVWAKTFARGAIRLGIENRTVLGRFVIDHERVSFGNAPPIQTIAIYETRADLIKHVWFIQEPYGSEID